MWVTILGGTLYDALSSSIIRTLPVKSTNTVYLFSSGGYQTPTGAMIGFQTNPQMGHSHSLSHLDKIG